MKLYKSVALLACVGLAGLTVQQLNSKPDNAQARLVTNFGFGLKAAGCWYGHFQAAIPDAPPPMPVVFTMNADGTGVVTSPEMHGSGAPDIFGKRTAFHFAYVRTGVRTTAWTGIDFATDANGTIGVPAYGGAGILRISGEGGFDRDFQTYTGTGIIDAFMADQDPLDPNETPVVSVPITLQWHRVNVQ